MTTKNSTSIDNGLRVLSLFDGIGCGRQALSELGIKVDKYYASEIDKYAIDVAMRNHPDIVELGDVTRWQEWQIDWRNIDLLIGGSPCQGLSYAAGGKRSNLDDERSKLIFCFFDILDHIKSVNPRVKFLLENVKMKKSCKEVIDSRMGVEGVHINSNLFSAQNRDRIYWTNLDIPTLPSGNDSVIQDIVEEDADSRLYLTKRHHQGFLRSYHWKPNLLNEKSSPLLASYHKQPPHSPYIPINSRIEEELYSGFRRLSPVECERLQTLPVGYTEFGARGKRISDSQRYKMIGNGWTVAVIKHLFSSLGTINLSLIF